MGTSLNSSLLNIAYLNGDENFKIRILQRKIRCAEEPDNPSLIVEYLKMTCCDSQVSDEIVWESLMTQFNLLLETMIDDCLPIHWRCACLDHIHRPLFSLQKKAVSVDNRQEVRLLFHLLKLKGDKLQADLFA